MTEYPGGVTRKNFWELFGLGSAALIKEAVAPKESAIYPIITGVVFKNSGVKGNFEGGTTYAPTRNEGLGGWPISLYKPENPNDLQNTTWNLLATTETREDGGYLFEEVPDGIVWVQIGDSSMRDKLESYGPSGHVLVHVNEPTHYAGGQFELDLVKKVMGDQKP